MADTNDGDTRGGTRQVDLIFGLRGGAPEAGADSKAAETPEDCADSETLAAILATLGRVEARLDALTHQTAERGADTKRRAEAAGETEAAMRGLRRSVDTAAQMTANAHEALGGRLATLEAAVDKLPAPEAAGALVEHLKLARSNLAGLSERTEGLERRLSERFEPIDGAAAAVRKTSDELAATARTLDAAAERDAQVLPTVTEVHREVRKLRRAACWGWGVASCLVVMLFLVVADYLFSLIGRWLTTLKAMVLG